MKRKIYKSITFAMILGIILFPSQGIIYAQVEDPTSSESITQNSIDNTSSNVDTANSEKVITEVNDGVKTFSTAEENLVLQDSVDTLVIQDTFNTQESVDHTTLIDTKDEVEIVVEESKDDSDEDSGNDTIIEDDGIGNEIIEEENKDKLPPEEEEEAEDVGEEILPQEEIIQEEIKEEVIPIVEISKPKPLYRFTFNKNITAYKKINNPEKEIARLEKEKQVLNKKSKIANAPSVEDKFIPETIDAPIDNTVSQNIDSESGIMTLSGTCSDTYFVVLLYKNQSDYTEDRGSYILNKAFKCENGSFSYSVSDLPSNLETGTYYMLIGDQGSRGTWTPATQLTEININRE